jgi:hypothetical protein
MSDPTPPTGAGWPGAIGVVGHGVNTPRRHDHHVYTDLCGAHGHPGVTFHPYMAADLSWSLQGSTWCQCGRARSDGNSVEWPIATDCGGRLAECVINEPVRDETRSAA